MSLDRVYITHEERTGEKGIRTNKKREKIFKHVRKTLGSGSRKEIKLITLNRQERFELLKSLEVVNLQTDADVIRQRKTLLVVLEEFGNKYGKRLENSILEGLRMKQAEAESLERRDHDEIQELKVLVKSLGGTNFKNYPSNRPVELFELNEEEVEEKTKIRWVKIPTSEIKSRYRMLMKQQLNEKNVKNYVKLKRLENLINQRDQQTIEEGSKVVNDKFHKRVKQRLKYRVDYYEGIQGKLKIAVEKQKQLVLCLRPVKNELNAKKTRFQINKEDLKAVFEGFGCFGISKARSNSVFFLFFHCDDTRKKEKELKIHFLKRPHETEGNNKKSFKIEFIKIKNQSFSLTRAKWQNGSPKELLQTFDVENSRNKVEKMVIPERIIKEERKIDSLSYDKQKQDGLEKLKASVLDFPEVPMKASTKKESTQNVRKNTENHQEIQQPKTVKLLIPDHYTSGYPDFEKIIKSSLSSVDTGVKVVIHNNYFLPQQRQVFITKETQTAPARQDTVTAPVNGARESASAGTSGKILPSEKIPEEVLVDRPKPIRVTGLITKDQTFKLPANTSKEKTLPEIVLSKNQRWGEEDTESDSENLNLANEKMSWKHKVIHGAGPKLSKIQNRFKEGIK
eukprot:augustus_masked-scaffold_5-processed-gene-20.26-mRNA-1 protein AED:1.00 eAED:1.00 QI:0/0/0/0/1/1/2/0/623